MLLIFCGPATIGKDSIWLPAAESLNFSRYVPYTSRKIRKNETNSVDYNFLSMQLFQEKIANNLFLEWDYFHSNYYGTGRDILELTNKYDIVMHALTRMAYRIREKIPNTIIISLTSKNREVIQARMRSRNYNNSDLVIRNHHVEEENRHSVFADIIINNAENITHKQAIKYIHQAIKKT